MNADAILVLIAAAFGWLFVFGFRRSDRPRRTIERYYGDATERRARLRLVVGGRR